MHLDMIIDCTDKLLAQWREIDDSNKVHLDMKKQTDQLLLAIFGFIAFDYDLQTLDNTCEKGTIELVGAMEIFLKTAFKVINMPSIVSRAYLLLNLKYRRSCAIIHQYIKLMIEQELSETAEIRAERKRTSLIAALVSSLQHNEKVEATKIEENKKGIIRLSISYL